MHRAATMMSGCVRCTADAELELLLSVCVRLTTASAPWLLAGAASTASEEASSANVTASSSEGRMVASRRGAEEGDRECKQRCVRSRTRALARFQTRQTVVSHSDPRSSRHRMQNENGRGNRRCNR